MTAVSDEVLPAPVRLLVTGWTNARTAWPTFVAELAADWPVWLLAAIYLAVANAAAALLPSHPPIDYLLYAGVWLRGGIAALLVYILVRTLPAIVRERPEHPFVLLLWRSAAVATPRAFAGLALIVLQVVLMGAFTSVKNMLPSISGYVWDARLAHLDAILFGGHDPWTFLTPLIARLHLLAPVEFLYLTGWALAVVLVPAIVALAPGLKSIRVRFFVTYLLSWVLIGNLLALAFLSAGPVYFVHVAGDAERFRPLVELLAADSGSKWSAYDLQHALWYLYDHGVVSFGSGISAFPSEHVAMATLWAIAGFRKNAWFGAAGVIFLAFVEVASVALGWHYAIDGLVSMVLVMGVWVCVGWLLPGAAHEQGESAQAC